jgi:hypothetical protein
MFYLDWTMLLLIPPMLLAIYASAKVRATFRAYSRYPASSGATGAEAARTILLDNGLADVAVQRIPGDLTDHYDPRSRKLSLSEPVYGSSSLAALGVAAHETGHALQHATGYAPLKVRQGIWPVAAFGSNLGPVLFMVGFIMLLAASGAAPLAVYIAKAGIFIFAGATAFTVLTLPVELNASRRALQALTVSGLVAPAERADAKKVLDAAALTYLAAAFMSIMMLLRFILLLSSVSSRRR